VCNDECLDTELEILGAGFGFVEPDEMLFDTVTRFGNFPGVCFSLGLLAASDLLPGVLYGSVFPWADLFSNVVFVAGFASFLTFVMLFATAFICDFGFVGVFCVLVTFAGSNNSFALDLEVFAMRLDRRKTLDGIDLAVFFFGAMIV
jgi:hypothetical protein